MKACLSLLLALPLGAQVFTFTRDQMLRYTALNPYGRFSDGRPKVPDALLEKCKALTVEDAWEVLREAGYRNQYEGDWKILHPGMKLVGRAVTAQYMPARPDVSEVADADALAKGMPRSLPERVIDQLQPNDVVVVDLFGKVENGTFGGDNLHTAIYAAAKTGFVIHGGIRDLEGVHEIASAGYYRGVTPSSFKDVMLTGINIPIRIGQATVMPGDVVLGDRTGVFFIPPHLVEKVLARKGK